MRPLNEKTAARAAAEQQWLAFSRSTPVFIFRLAGVYGPGRSALEVLPYS